MKGLAKLCFDREDCWLFGKDVLFLNDSLSWNLTLILFCNSLSSCLWMHITTLVSNNWKAVLTSKSDSSTLQENDERSVAALPLLSGKLLAPLGKSWRLLKDQFPEYKLKKMKRTLWYIFVREPTEQRKTSRNRNIFCVEENKNRW